ncbi:MAG: bacteriophage CI repressor [Desulfobacteraceae bacterium]|nr:bacteriophage CI repressor [Desulfobacteraceae bacterium]
MTLKQFKNIKDVALSLNISASDFSQRKRRGSLLPLIIEWGLNESINIDWLLTGQNMQEKMYTGEIPPINSEIASTAPVSSTPEIASTAPETAHIKAIEPVIPGINEYLSSMASACRIKDYELLSSVIGRMEKIVSDYKKVPEEQYAEVHNIKDIGHHHVQYEPVQEELATGTEGKKKQM